MNTESAEAFMRDGCGRCDRYRTPSCKVHRWTAPLELLRDLVLASGLTETMKWGSPCYMVDGRNVVMLAVFNDHCAVSFFKGMALDDPDTVLESAGPNSRFVRFVRFRTVADVEHRRRALERLLDQAIALERAGHKIVVPPAAEPVPDELQQRLDADPAVRDAFARLTPGRRRSHILHIAGAKQSATRDRRVEACVPVILAGRGFNER